eukprot:849855-Prymnesium_polylepis.1
MPEPVAKYIPIEAERIQNRPAVKWRIGQPGFKASQRTIVLQVLEAVEHLDAGAAGVAVAAGEGWVRRRLL